MSGETVERSRVFVPDPSAKVFGYLYGVVLSTGVVKVGVSKDRPEGRIASHAQSAKGFGVTVCYQHIAPVYTNNLFDIEKRVCDIFRMMAPSTQGKEWFQMPSVEFAQSAVQEYVASVSISTYKVGANMDDVVGSSDQEFDVLCRYFRTMRPSVRVEILEIAKIFAKKFPEQ